MNRTASPLPRTNMLRPCQGRSPSTRVESWSRVQARPIPHGAFTFESTSTRGPAASFEATNMLAET